MAKQLKQVRIEESFIDEVQEIANEDFDGNFTAALIDCALAGVNMRKIPAYVRDELKSAGVRYGGDFKEFYNDRPRVVIDALQI